MKVPTRNIEWTEVQKESSPEVEELKSIFVHYKCGIPYAVCYWDSRRAREAQLWLKSISFARCSRDDCGIRLGSGQRLGDECRNH